MTATNDFLSLMGAAPATPSGGIVQLPYQGQMYNISTEGYNTEDEAVQAFLEGRNEPASIEPTDQNTDVVDITPSTVPTQASTSFDFSQAAPEAAPR